MKRSALARAFQLLNHKPMLLLLYLPVQAVILLGLKFLMPTMGDINAALLSPEVMIPYLLYYPLAILLSLGSLLLLLPPSMELLSDGAAGLDTPPGWYKRGLKRHWWKPFAVYGIQQAVVFIIIIAFYVIEAFLMFFLFTFLAAGSGLPDSATPSLAAMLPILIILGLSVLLMTAVLYVVLSAFSLLLPASADLSFGKAWKVTFTKGWKKLPRLTGVYLLTNAVSMVFLLGLGAGYAFMSGRLDEIIAIKDIMETVYAAITLFSGYFSSWTGYFCLLITSASALFLLAYQFCVYQELKDEACR